MQRRQSVGPVMRALLRLAIDGNDLAGNHRADRRDPGAEALLESVRVQQREHPPKGIVRRDAVGQFQEPPKP